MLRGEQIREHIDRLITDLKEDHLKGDVVLTQNLAMFQIAAELDEIRYQLRSFVELMSRKPTIRKRS